MNREAVSPVERLQYLLHGWVAFGIMPLFAFANAGVPLGQISFDGDALWVFAGVAIGLTLGKPLGILAVSWLAVRLRLAALPNGVRWSHVSIVGMVGGIGFTMALFIAQLAFPQGQLLETAKFAVLCGSGLAAALSLLAGYRVLKVDRGPNGAVIRRRCRGFNLALNRWSPRLTSRTSSARRSRACPTFPKSCYRLFMAIGFLDRLKMAWRVLIDARFAEEVDEGLKQFALARAKTSDPPERVHASGLMLLAAFQREGRLVDFLQQETAGFSDEEIGAAARVVHGGCHKALQQFFEIAPAVKGAEGAPMSVPAGFDSERIRLTGNVSGQPPFKGVLKHHGWLATQVRMPSISQTLDPRVIAPAEVELP